MDKFLVKKNKKLPWEIVLDNYISSNSDSLFVLQNQKYFWVNVNYRKDFLTIKGF